MRGAMKMAMINTMRNDARGSMNYEAQGNYRMEGGGGNARMEGGGTYRMEGGQNEIENRRRRGRNGRFIRSEMEGTNNTYQNEMRYESEYREPMQIGFRYEDDSSRYRSDTGYPRMNESEHRTSKMEKGHAQGKGRGKMDRKTAEQWLQQMKNADGSKGPHWSMEQTKLVMEQLGLDCDPLEGWVAMNMLYSDYVDVAKKLGVNNVDFWANMALAFLEDEDAHEGKLMRYYTSVVE